MVLHPMLVDVVGGIIAAISMLWAILAVSDPYHREAFMQADSSCLQSLARLVLLSDEVLCCLQCGHSQSWPWALSTPPTWGPVSAGVLGAAHGAC